MESMHRVEPISPVAAWIGGKRNLAGRITRLIEQIPHSAYCEPFVGMGGVFFRRQLVPKAEVVNDISRDVATLFRILQRHYVFFLEMLKFQLTTRSEFERLTKTDPDTLTDLERAARFLYLQRLSFGGKVAGRTFGVSPGMPARFDVTKLQPLLEAAHERLAGVIIEALPFDRFIPRYDRPGALFYCDPPYWGCEDDYGKRIFEPVDFERLAALLAGIKGAFLLSINDTPEIRQIFAAFHLIEVETTYSTGLNPPKKAPELLISNVAGLTLEREEGS